MAAEVTITQGLEVTALAGGDESRILKFTHSITPVETVQGKPLIGTTAVT
ncbi:MAG: hypothetical protein IMZ70_05220, partial [Candidatus Atribacteria bacterium]|nr:hypothetical protein [Candidatus Atribacteria bacterium]